MKNTRLSTEEHIIPTFTLIAFLPLEGGMLPITHQHTTGSVRCAFFPLYIPFLHQQVCHIVLVLFDSSQSCERSHIMQHSLQCFRTIICVAMMWQMIKSYLFSSEFFFQCKCEAKLSQWVLSNQKTIKTGRRLEHKRGLQP